MSKNRVFISYDFENDRHYRNLLTAWDEHDNFDFEFYDGSLKAAVDSENASYIRSVIKPMILRSTHFLCIIGAETYKSAWVAWEIEKAVEGGLQIIALKIDVDYIAPVGLFNVGARWLYSFNFEGIKEALR